MLKNNKMIIYPDELKVTANIAVDPITREIKFEHTGAHKKEDFVGKTFQPGTVTFEDAFWGGGSSVILSKKEEKQDTIIAVWRDSGARIYPNMLDTFSGWGSTNDPVLGILKEAVEEVLTLRESKAFVINFEEPSLRKYNQLLKEVVIPLASEFGITQTTEITVSLAEFENPFNLNGVQVDLSFAKDKDGLTFLVSMDMVPLIYKIENGKDIVFRETLGIETKGKVPERNVVEFDLQTTETSVYNKGVLTNHFSNLNQFIEKSGVDPKSPFTENLRGVLGQLKGYELPKMIRDGKSTA